jgi:UDPglucose 6-dehydrogenase
MTQPVIGFAGMTHLGLNSAAAAAARGFRTIGFSADPNVIAELEVGRLPVIEPDLPETIAKNRSRLSFSADPDALAACDVCYIATDVPTDDHGRSDLSGINKLIVAVRSALKPSGILVVLCQVPPGFTRAIAPPRDRIYYQVETLIFGRAIDRALHPERFIVGCADPATPLHTAFQEFLQSFGCPILPMRYESAELAKIAINFCLVASVSVANTLAEVCEGVGADWPEIVPALKLDRRIGNFAYLDAGLGISGGNLERDLATVLRIGEANASHLGVVRAWLDNSRHRKDWPWHALQDAGIAGNKDARVGVLGLAYKENTNSTKNSPALVLLEHLRDRKVRVHDPVVSASVAPWAEPASDPLNAAVDADALVLVTPWPEYRKLDPSALARAMRGRILVDPYRLLSPAGCRRAGFTYYALGMTLPGEHPLQRC